MFDPQIDKTINMVTTMVNKHVGQIESFTFEYVELEADGDYTIRPALQELCKTLPFGAVGDYYCLKKNVPVETQCLAQVKHYPKQKRLILIT